MFGIIGSGFGLYGYLPALVHLGEEKVFLPATSREKLLSRPDLKKYFDKIDWVENNDDLIAKVSHLIIAVTPKAQEYFIEKILKNKNNIKNLYIEKPVARNPILSQTLLLKLYEKNIDVRIAYLFRYTNWGKDLLDRLNYLSSKDQIRLCWNFRAHHIEKNIETWKRNQGDGGGIIGFYGIHLLAIISDMGYKGVCLSQIFKGETSENDVWQVISQSENLPTLHISLNINSSKNSFEICIKETEKREKYFFKSRDPFDCNDKRFSGDDRRVSTLIEYLKDNKNLHLRKARDLRVAPLWNLVESITTTSNVVAEKSTK